MLNLKDKSKKNILKTSLRFVVKNSNYYLLLLTSIFLNKIFKTHRNIEKN